MIGAKKGIVVCVIQTTIRMNIDLDADVALIIMNVTEDTTLMTEEENQLLFGHIILLTKTIVLSIGNIVHIRSIQVSDHHLHHHLFLLCRQKHPQK